MVATAALAAVLLAAAPAADGAVAADTPGGPSEIAMTLSPAQPGAAAELALTIVYRSSSDPEGKPPALQTLSVEAPAGTTFDLTGLPACTATDAELRLLGRGVCPDASQVATGSIRAVTGLGAPVDPVAVDIVAFNTGTGIVETASLAGTGLVIAIDRVTIDGSTLVAHPPTTPGGPPDFRTAISEISLTFPASTGFVTAPAECPASGRWEYSAAIGFADGTFQSPTGAMPCAAVTEVAPEAEGSLAESGGGAVAPRAAAVTGTTLAATGGAGSPVALALAAAGLSGWAAGQRARRTATS